MIRRKKQRKYRELCLGSIFLKELCWTNLGLPFIWLNCQQKPFAAMQLRFPQSYNCTSGAIKWGTNPCEEKDTEGLIHWSLGAPLCQAAWAKGVKAKTYNRSEKDSSFVKSKAPHDQLRFHSSGSIGHPTPPHYWLSTLDMRTQFVTGHVECCPPATPDQSSPLQSHEDCASKCFTYTRTHTHWEYTTWQVTNCASLE